MEDFAVIYLLSILDGVGKAFAVGGGLVGFASLAGLVIIHLNRVGSTGYKTSEAYYTYLAKFEKLLRVTTCLGLIFWGVGYMMPGRRALVEAYVMVEGSKVLTAENGEKMAEEVAQRFDRVLGIIEDKAVEKVTGEVVGTAAKETTEKSEKIE